jgi:Asp-tRNA(Asn)/Glu-tRNA(Gln) amidotransferase A subunit family amidase
VLRTRAWEGCGAALRAAFEAQLDALRAQGIGLLLSEEDAEARAFEADFADWIGVFMDIVCWEMRWPMAMYAEDGAGLIAERASGFLRHGLAMQRADYARALARRQAYRDAYAAFARRVDAVVTPATVGPAPVGLGFTGPPEFNALSSGLAVPALSLPMMQVEGLPVGLQLMGFLDGDADLVAVARHVWETRPR